MEAIVSLAAVFVPALLVFGIVYLVEGRKAMFTVGQRVRVIERVDLRYGQEGEITMVNEQEQVCAVRFDDGEELGFLLDDNEIEAC